MNVVKAIGDKKVATLDYMRAALTFADYAVKITRMLVRSEPGYFLVRMDTTMEL